MTHQTERLRQGQRESNGWKDRRMKDQGGAKPGRVYTETPPTTSWNTSTRGPIGNLIEERGDALLGNIHTRGWLTGWFSGVNNDNYESTK